VPGVAELQALREMMDAAATRTVNERVENRDTVLPFGRNDAAPT